MILGSKRREATKSLSFPGVARWTHPPILGRISRIFFYLKAKTSVLYGKTFFYCVEFAPMRFLPVFLDLTEGVVGLVGAGPAALNKLRLLRSAGARVRWYSKDVGVAEEVLTAALSGPLEICFADPRQADFADCIAVVSAAGDALDDDIAALARSQHVPVNVVDRPELSTFIFPAIVDRGDVVVAIGTGGTSPVLARRLRERIEALLPARIGDLAALDGPLPRARGAGAARRALAAAVLGARRRRSDRRRGAGRALARCRAGADARHRTFATKRRRSPAPCSSSAPVRAPPTC